MIILLLPLSLGILNLLCEHIYFCKDLSQQLLAIAMVFAFIETKDGLSSAFVFILKLLLRTSVILHSRP